MSFHVVLRRMVAGLVLLCSTDVMAASPEIERDKHVYALGEALKAEDFAQAQTHLDALFALPIDLPDSVFYYSAETAFKLCDIDRAEEHLETYFDRSGTEGRYYKQALKLSIDMDAAAETPQCLKKVSDAKQAEQQRRQALLDAASSVHTAWKEMPSGKRVVHQLKYDHKSHGPAHFRLTGRTFYFNGAKDLKDKCVMSLYASKGFQHLVDHDQYWSLKGNKRKNKKWIEKRFSVFDYEYDEYRLTVDFRKIKGLKFSRGAEQSVEWLGRKANYYTVLMSWEEGVAATHRRWELSNTVAKVKRSDDGEYFPLEAHNFAPLVESGPVRQIVMISEYDLKNWRTGKFHDAVKQLATLCQA